jgi:hypothetical protein
MGSFAPDDTAHPQMEMGFLNGANSPTQDGKAYLGLLVGHHDVPRDLELRAKGLSPDTKDYLV